VLCMFEIAYDEWMYLFNCRMVGTKHNGDIMYVFSLVCVVVQVYITRVFMRSCAGVRACTCVSSMHICVRVLYISYFRMCNNVVTPVFVSASSYSTQERTHMHS